MLNNDVYLTYKAVPICLHENSLPQTILNKKLAILENNRIRYARAIAEDSGMQREFNLFSEDLLEPDGSLQPFTQLRLDPDSTIRIHDSIHKENEEAPDEMRVHKIQLNPAINISYKVRREELETLVKKYALRAGTFEERTEFIAEQVNSYSLDKLYEEFSKNPHFKSPQYSADDADLKSLGRHKFSARVNNDIRLTQIYIRLGLCLPAIITQMVVENEKGLRNWVKDHFEQLPKNTILSKMTHWIMDRTLKNINNKVKLAEFTLDFITRVRGYNSPISCAKLSGQLLNQFQDGISRDISETRIEH